MNSARNTLFELQVEQHRHDETYHREIARLSLHHRLSHMALHFAKYAGKVATASRTDNVNAIYTDVLIIALSTANILNADLWKLLEPENREFPSLLVFGRVAARTLSGAMEDRAELIRTTTAAAGRIATACEKIDHLEEISFRSEIKAGLAQLAAISLAVLALQNIDPEQAVRARLDAVKQRLTLHGRI